MKNKRIIIMTLAAILTASLLTGCGSRDEGSYEGTNSMGGSRHAKAMMNDSYVAAESAAGGAYDDFDYEEAAEYDDGGDITTTATEVTENGAAQSGRKLIRTVHLTVETLEYDALINTVKNRVTQLGGYFENLSESRNNYGSQVRYANMTIRIPKDKADELITVMENESNILDRSENVNDVTLDYVDMESHKKVLSAEQDRLLKLMDQAESIEDIITIEERLSEVRYQIESMESQLRTYDNKIDYTTINLNVSEVEKITPVEEPDFFSKVSEGFSESVQGAIEVVQDIIAWIVINIPYLILWAIFILFMIFVVIRPIARKMKKSSEKRKREYQDFIIRKTAAASGAPVTVSTPEETADTDKKKPAKGKKGKAEAGAEAKAMPEAEPAPEVPQPAAEGGSESKDAG